MYTEMSDETRDFFNMMMENELLMYSDVRIRLPVVT